MPTAITPNEGLQLVGNLIFKNADANRGTSLELGLFTNDVAPTESSVLADIVEPTGGSYARKVLTDASWTVGTDGLCTYAIQTFTATGSAYSETIKGFFIATTGTTPMLLRFQVEDAAISVAQDETYSVTPSISIGSTTGA